MTLPIDSWRKGTRSSAERGYGVHWQRARHRFLLNHPLCVMCTANGHTTPADVVDHIQPHRGDRALFWDETNWQALCKMHHDSDKARLERGGRERARFDPSGRLIW
jgi:5-methylcytosine-specific restriction endonuclease McrA